MPFTFSPHKENDVQKHFMANCPLLDSFSGPRRGHRIESAHAKGKDKRIFLSMHVKGHVLPKDLEMKFLALELH